MIVFSSSTVASPPSFEPYAAELATEAVAGARTGQRVAVLVVGPNEERAVMRAVSKLVDGDQKRWWFYPSSRDGVPAGYTRPIQLDPSGPGGGSIFVATYADALAGSAFDLVVASDSVREDSDLLAAARKRLRVAA